NLIRNIRADQISFLEDVGSFTISALSQIDITSRHEAERRNRARPWNMALPLQNIGQAPLSILTSSLASLKDFGDLSSFARDKTTGGAINAYLVAEANIQGSILRGYPEKGSSENPICEAAKQLPSAWMHDMVATSPGGTHASALTRPADKDRMQSRAQNILHQIAGGCYKDINVMELKDALAGKLVQFKYTPIIDALNQRWASNIKSPYEIEGLRQQIDRDIDRALSKVSPSCKHMMSTAGVDGVKSAVGGEKSKPAKDSGSKPAKDSKSKPGVDGTKPGTDGVKS
ncbi:MAG: hypothetical protein K2X47_06935, partial [Bdellovibrionales bacterium]|nr:hypothetical protein [Bdellovibrionales bacterium]